MKRFKGKISRDYDLIPQAVPSYYELEDTLATSIAALYRNPVVVDIGLGTGITTKAIVERNPGCMVRGVDNERSMIEQARSRLEAEVARGIVEVCHSDALEYLRSLHGASVDVVASAYTIHNCSKSYRTKLEREIFRILRPGGMLINNDKYAADDRREYIRELTNQIVRYDVLKEQAREDLRRIWIEHELIDQDPGRIMRTRESLDQLTSIGFSGATLIKRIGQYALMVAYKPTPETIAG